jgi:hypothetical protein
LNQTGACVAICHHRAYVKRMAQTTLASASGLSRAMIVVVVAIGAMIAGTIALWLHYGTAVFYEMIVAGLAACF